MHLVFFHFCISRSALINLNSVNDMVHLLVEIAQNQTLCMWLRNCCNVFSVLQCTCSSSLDIELPLFLGPTKLSLSCNLHFSMYCKCMTESWVELGNMNHRISWFQRDVMLILCFICKEFRSELEIGNVTVVRDRPT